MRENQFIDKPASATELALNNAARYKEMGLGHYKKVSYDDSWVTIAYDLLIDYWEKFLKVYDSSLTDVDYFVNKQNLKEVVIRIDVRSAYYYVYHNNADICEHKWVGLCAYWINTLKPFTVFKENSDLYNCPNEMFSLFLITSIVRALFDEIKKTSPQKIKVEKFPYLSHAEVIDIIYDFKFCDLSREAMLLFVEMFARSCGVGMDVVPREKKISDSD